jgi:hypothetical protein
VRPLLPSAPVSSRRLGKICRLGGAAGVVLGTQWLVRASRVPTTTAAFPLQVGWQRRPGPFGPDGSGGGLASLARSAEAAVWPLLGAEAPCGRSRRGWAARWLLLDWAARRLAGPSWGWAVAVPVCSTLGPSWAVPVCPPPLLGSDGWVGGARSGDCVGEPGVSCSVSSSI